MRLRLGRTQFPAINTLVFAELALLAATSLASSPRGFSEYIRSGLGYSQASDSTDQPGNSTEPDGDALAALALCATSWASYSSQLSYHVATVTSPTTSYSAWSTSLAYGTGDVYTTVAGIPVASGNFTPTRTVATVYNITSSQTFTDTITRRPTDTPKCSFSPQDCSRLYVSYLSSLGLAPNATVPKITPAPTNSPPCPAYYYQPLSTCSYTSRHNYANDCHIYGNSVQLFYFPTQTSNLSVSSPDPTAPPRVYSWAPGTTFTSPSVYLSFDYLSAERLINDNRDYICTTCDQAGCRQMAVDGGQQRKIEGTSIPGQLITMGPGEVKSVVMDYNSANASSIVNVLAHGLPDYSTIMDQMFDMSLASKVTYKSLRFEDVSHPPPEAYYLQPTPASGCNMTSPDPQCSTIFEGQYRALISLPTEVTGLQGPWSTCTPVIYGVYDPPLALSEASYAAGITMPHGSTPTEYGHTQQSDVPAAAPTAPDITVPRTAPDSTPKPTRLPPAESAVLPSESPNANGQNSGGDTGSGSNGSGSNDDSPHDGSGQGDAGDSPSEPSNNGGSGGDASAQDDNGSSPAAQDTNGGNVNSGATRTGVAGPGAGNGDDTQTDGNNSGRPTRTNAGSSGASAPENTSSAASGLLSAHLGWQLLVAILSLHVVIP